MRRGWARWKEGRWGYTTSSRAWRAVARRLLGNAPKLKITPKFSSCSRNWGKIRILDMRAWHYPSGWIGHWWGQLSFLYTETCGCWEGGLKWGQSSTNFFFPKKNRFRGWLRGLWQRNSRTFSGLWAGEPRGLQNCISGFIATFCLNGARAISKFWKNYLFHFFQL